MIETRSIIVERNIELWVYYGIEYVKWISKYSICFSFGTILYHMDFGWLWQFWWMRILHFPLIVLDILVGICNICTIKGSDFDQSNVYRETSTKSITIWLNCLIGVTFCILFDLTQIRTHNFIELYYINRWKERHFTFYLNILLCSDDNIKWQRFLMAKCLSKK